MMDILKLAWRNLFRNPRRTIASLLTVALGSTGLLIYQGFNEGIMNLYRDNTVHAYYGHGQVYPKGYYGKVHEKPWELWISNPDEVEKKIRSSKSVVEVYPRVSFYSFLVKGGITLGGHGEGVLPERERSFFNLMNFISGTDLQTADDIILGKGLAESLGVKIGDTVTLLMQTIHGQLNGADLKVSGIFHMGKKSVDDSFFRVHLEQAQHLLDTKSVESFSLATKGVEYWDQVQRDIEQASSTLEPIRFEILDKVYYQNAIDFLEAQFSFIRNLILIIVALGIFNSISVGLLERSGELGALRANGEKQSRLFKILVIENAFLGFLGGAIGIILAIIVNHTLLTKGVPMPPGPGFTRHFRVLLDMRFWHFVQSLGLPLLATVLASIWPIRKLLTKSIPELLRST